MITQAQFDRIYLGLAAQGWERSYDEDMRCACIVAPTVASARSAS
ncbi:hypothetical protein [Mesorhizobium sp. M0621]